MKKRFLFAKYKRYQAKRQRKALKYSIQYNKLYHRLCQRRERSIEAIADKAERKNIRINGKRYKELYVPVNFSLKENPKEVISFLNRLIYYVTNRNNVHMNLKEVCHVTVDSLLSVVAILDARGDRFVGSVSGNYPKDKEVSRLIKDYGFYDAIRAKSVYNLHAADSNIFAIKSGTGADPNIINELISFAGIKMEDDKYLLTRKKLCNTLFEIIGNANEHAYKSNEYSIKLLKRCWYVSAYRKEHEVCFVALDNGQGIARTIRKKGTEKAKIIFDRVAQSIFGERVDRIISDCDLVKAAFCDVNRSESGEKYRGKGLTVLYNRNMDILHDFTVVTNKAFVNITTDRQVILSPQSDGLHGTLYSWKIIL